MNLKNVFVRTARFLKARYAPRGGRVGFSHTGEDVLIDAAMKKFDVRKPTYIDIGAHDPIFSNNTYLFYRQGGQGVIVEPNEALCTKALRTRPRDMVLCAGAAKKDGVADFFAFPQSTRSTFSKSQAEEWYRTSGQQADKKSRSLYSLDTIIAKYCHSTAPDIISIDAEGFDAEILAGFSWNVRPKIFCVESSDLGNLFTQHHYAVWAKTPVNTIFIDTLLQ